MNPITAVRELLMGLGEGQRMRMFGHDYLAKEEAARLENAEIAARSGREAALFPLKLESEQLSRDEALAKKLERLATAKHYGLEPTEAGSADARALIAKQEQERATAVQNAQIEADKVRMEGDRARLPHTQIPESAARLLRRMKPTDVGPAEPLTNMDAEILLDREKEAGVDRRHGQSLAAMRERQAAYGSNADDSDVQAAADRVTRGELTIDQARGLLGGVRGGKGAALLKALGDRKVVPAAVRKDIVGIQTTRNIVDKMEELVEDIVNAKDATERAEAILLLEQFGRTTGTLLSRGFGERGVVTDRDVARATGLVPGWKAANFAPEYARREIALLRDVLDRNERGVTEGYFREHALGGGSPAPVGTDDPDPLGILGGRR